ncbi:MAG: lamin tail domain-containing protein [Patescibacteria group bacterium]
MLHSSRRFVPYFAGFIAGALAFGSAPPLRAETAVPCVLLSSAAASADTPEPPPTISEPPVPAEPPPPFVIRFNELLPDPVGKDIDGEFIELAFSGQGTPSGWKIADSKGRTFDLTGVEVTGGLATLNYATTKLQLTNDGDSLTLQDPAGLLTDTVSYGAAKEGQAFAKSPDGGWSWTPTPTPGSDNIFPAPAVTTMIVAAAAPTGQSGLIPPTPPPVETPPAPLTPIRLILSELMPNPRGGDQEEWIEVANAEDHEVALTEWSLTDKSGGRFVFKNEHIAAAGVIVVTKPVTKISLNNDAETLTLAAPDGSITDATSYAKAPEGSSWTRIGGVWIWSELPTPGQRENAQITPKVEEKTEASSAPPPAPADIPSAVPASLDELPDIEPGTRVEVSGTVSAAAGSISKQILVIQNDGAAAFVRVSGSRRPEFVVGQVLRVRGRLTRHGHETHLSASLKDIEKTGRAAIERAEKDVEAIGPSDAGLMVTLDGKISRVAKRAIYLSDDAGRKEIRVNAPSQGFPPAEEGSGARVTGVLRYAKDDPEITVIDRRDVAFNEKKTVAVHDAPSPRTLVMSSNESRSRSAFAAAAATAMLLAACIAAYWYRRKTASNPSA